MAILGQPNYIPPNLVAAASAALLGNKAASAKAMARVRRTAPELRIANLNEFFPLRRAEDFERWTKGLRKAGLLE